MDRVAENYVRLALAVGRHDPDYVDAYYGPPAWKEEARERPLAGIRSEADELLAELRDRPSDSGDELARLRRHYLTRHLEAMLARIDMLSGERLSFDEESRALYDAVAPRRGAEFFEEILDRLESLVPGGGPLPERIGRFRQGFVIPLDRLEAVLQATAAECRRRTMEHLELPPGESFSIELVSDMPWIAYHWYQGNFQSRIQVNTSLPLSLDRAIDIGCHEGYPGHHAHNALLEKHLVRGRGWPELSIYLLFSPQSLIAEGTANFGVEVAFPGEERALFERERLCPLAGLDPAQADRYFEVTALTRHLSYAWNEAAREYLDGRMERAQAVDFLMRCNLASREEAGQLLQFIERFRSYVINYNHGQDLVRDFVERQGGTGENPAKRWEVLAALLTSPRVPSGLQMVGSRA